MYKITIKTKTNTFNIEVENYNSPEVKQLLENSYIEELRIEKIKTLRRVKNERGTNKKNV